MRPINADEFEVIEFQGKSEEFINGAMSILEMIDNTPNIDKYESKWITCSERLPDKYGEYLIAWKPKSWNKPEDRCLIEICEFETTGEWLTDYIEVEWDDEVIIYAWMPLPEPFIIKDIN